MTSVKSVVMNLCGFHVYCLPSEVVSILSVQEDLFSWFIVDFDIPNVAVVKMSVNPKESSRMQVSKSVWLISMQWSNKKVFVCLPIMELV